MRTRSLLPHLPALLLASHVAFGQAAAPGTAEARRAAYQKGTDAILAKNWAEAERIFKQLWTEHPTYDVALGLGQAEFLQLKYRDAGEHLTFGIRNFPPREKPEALDRPKRALEEIKKHVATIEIAVNRPGADVFVDASRVGKSPLDSIVLVDPGMHSLEARIADRSPTKQTIEAKAGEDQNVELEFIDPALLSGMGQPAAPATPRYSMTNGQPSAASDPLNYTPAVVTGGVAVAALATGVVLKLQADHEDTQRKQRVAQLPGSNRCGAQTPFSGECHTIASLADEAKTLRALSFASFGLALAGGVAAYFLWPRSSQNSQLGMRVAPLVAVSSTNLFTGIDGCF